MKKQYQLLAGFYDKDEWGNYSIKYQMTFDLPQS